MKAKYVSWAVVILCAGLVACGKKVPSRVIQPKEMESLLYDYHMATSLGYELSYSEGYKKEAYIDYVFRKHHVTEAEFDSSMVWYTRHSDVLLGIYDNLQKRLKAEEGNMKLQVAKRNNQISVSMSGDTVDVWQDRTLYWLTSSPLTNKVVFDLKADTTFKPHDALMLEADLLFMPQNRASGATVAMGMSFGFANDSTQGVVRTMSYPGPQRLYLKADSAFEFRNVSGFIYYIDGNGQKEKGSVLVNNIRLIRYHERQPVLQPDTLQILPADSLKPTLTR